MSDKSAIEWTDATWNPTTGCTKVSPGCAHCYIERTPAFRIAGRKFVRGATDLRLHAERLEQPLHWRKPRRVFVNSLSDLFHDDVPDVFIERVFSVMALAARHTFQVLTKRPARMRAWFEARRFDVKDYAILQTEKGGECLYAHPWPLPNVWLGVSVENQHFADERIPLLLQTPAAVRFVSYEPALEYVDFRRVRWPDKGEHRVDVLRGGFWSVPMKVGVDGFVNHSDFPATLDWIIFGLESGPHAREGDADWGRDLIAQCAGTRTAVFIKQLGAHPYDSDRTASGQSETLKLRDKKGGDPAEWPADLRVREFPGGDAGIAPSAAPEAQE